MRKVSIKIIFSLFVVFFITAIIPRVIIYMLRDLPAREIFESEIFLLGMATTAAITLLLFAAAMNVILVRRVKKLSEATREVASGNYDIHLIQEGKDEISSLTRDFNTMVESLKSNEYLNKEFVKNFSHEFKTPITNVKLANSMIRKSCADENDKIVQLTKVVQEENERLEMQVERVLLMSTFDNNQQQNIQKEDIHDILQKTMESFKLQISEKNGTIGFDLNANDFNIRCNRESLSRAFLNIIDNAVKYSKGNPEINILTYNKKNSLYIEFSDKGCGIKKEHLPNIFDKYFRVPTGNIHNVKGFGLGLAYVKNVIKSCGGNITVASKFGEGTVFTIEFPIE